MSPRRTCFICDDDGMICLRDAAGRYSIDACPRCTQRAELAFIQIQCTREGAKENPPEWVRRAA